MTTTLRPAEPLQQHPDGSRSRRYAVCVNSRPVGEIHLGTSPSLGPSVARVIDLRIAEPDRRRGRGTVAALAAEEVARGWGCVQMEAVVPATADAALRLFGALGYTVRNRGMEKRLGATPPALPPGSRARPITEAEFAAWREAESERYAREWIERGVPEAAARAKTRDDHARLLPHGLATEGVLFSVLEHEGAPVGTLWLALGDAEAFVFDVETGAAHRGLGHGRTLMLLAERQAIEAGRTVLGLNVFAGNTPAERLYASLGYETVTHSLSKPLL
ncbi:MULTISPECIES: GNAT family N-acetyltransferase [Streptomyces]|uniref:Acetyltransferase n=2 Tax=Streptomyces TaxID=1883 RepID=A0A117QBQ7_STRCK|nr:GNAT family N-acetyltransferase [Streptomyces corchorusii]AEY88240.1 acetyltransferase [Streptomyces hygroscopicus subsp. jinggangensis 5008]AGF62396.1 acetyltransferase [Streptomyces hygroscopicus subsp. jinggangensis TL01]KUN19572.1 acetyltransferase [Streptomyces corchorusii]